MPKAKSTELKIKCKTCNNFTECQEPVIIKRYGLNKFNIKTVCAICKCLKSKTLNEMQRKILPEEILTMIEKSEVVNNITREGKILPLLPILGLILSGIGAASGVAGTVASAVINSKKANEDKRHNETMEQIAQNVASGKGFNELNEIDKYKTSVNYLQGKGFQIYTT
jgi:hypothetical protein